MHAIGFNTFEVFLVGGGGGSIFEQECENNLDYSFTKVLVYDGLFYHYFVCDYFPLTSEVVSRKVSLEF